MTDSFSIAIVTERSAFMNRLRFLRLEFPAKKRTQGGGSRGESRQRKRKQIEVLIFKRSPWESAVTHKVETLILLDLLRFADGEFISLSTHLGKFFCSFH